jgi:signal transduction histidine kinase/ligand-binding sensor domain-containing protein
VKTLLFLWIWLVLILGTTAQVKTVKQYVRHYTISEGLPDNAIKKIQQDTLGRIWLGTNQGLCFYDGHIFKQLKATSKEVEFINTNDIVFLQVIDHQIWVSSSKNFAIINPYTLQLIENPKWIGNDEYVTAIQKDAANHCYWLSTNKYIIQLSFDLKLIKKSLYHSLNILDKSWIIDLFPINKQTLLINALSQDLIYMNTADWTTRIVTDPILNKKKQVPPLYAYYDNKNKKLYTSAWYSGIYTIEHDTAVLIPPFAKSKDSMLKGVHYLSCTDLDPKLYFCCNTGVFVYDKYSQEIEKMSYYGLNDNPLYLDSYFILFKDKFDNIWIGTSNGLLKYNTNERLVKILTQTLDLKNQKIDIYDFKVVNDSILYVSTFGNGLLKVNYKQHTYQSLIKSSMSYQWTVSSLANNNKLRITGHDPYIIDYDLKTKQIEPVTEILNHRDSSTICTFYFLDSKGNEWYSWNYNGGVLCKMAGSSIIKHFKTSDKPKAFPFSYANRMCEDKNGHYWFHTNKRSNFVEYNAQTNEFKEHTVKSSRLKSGQLRGVHNILPYGDSLIIATDGDGLIIYSPKTKVSQNIQALDGLAGNFTYSLVADSKRRIWIGTSKGLSCLSFKNKQILIDNFLASEGFIETNFELSSYYNANKNLIYLNTPHYVFQFNPDSLMKHKIKNFKPIIEELNINNILYQLDDPQLRTLNHNQNTITLSLSVVDFSIQNNYEFQVLLNGKEEDWKNLGKTRNVFYSNLKSGHYLFNVRVKQIGGEWHYLEKAFEFEIIAPYWKRWWFISLEVIWSLLATVLIIRSYFKRETKLELEKLKRQRAIEDERARIAADMHDDLGSGLMQIKYIAEEISESKFEYQVHELNKLKEKANEITENMGEIIWSMRDRNNSLEDLLYYMRSQFVQYSEENHLICIFEMPENIPQVIISGASRRNIYLICKECLHNIVKHAKATRAIILIQKKNNDLLIHIKDNGRGFDEKLAFDGNGLLNIKKRAQELEAKLFINSDSNGTNMQLQINLDNISINL